MVVQVNYTRNSVNPYKFDNSSTMSLNNITYQQHPPYGGDGHDHLHRNRHRLHVDATNRVVARLLHELGRGHR